MVGMDHLCTLCAFADDCVAHAGTGACAGLDVLSSDLRMVGFTLAAGR